MRYMLLHVFFSGLLVLGSQLPAAARSAQGVLPGHSQAADPPLNALFIENRGQVRDQHGQIRSDIDFVMKTPGVSVFIGAGKIEHVWYVPGKEEVRAHRIRMQLQGARAERKPVISGRQPYYETFFPEGAGRGISAGSATRITYPEIYPGIDWTIYIKDGQAEHDFILSPGARVADIQMQYEGMSGLRLDEDGSLLVSGSAGTLREHAPFAYTESDGKQIASAFVLQGDRVGFKVAPYEGRLIIDPVLEWATLYGGPSADFIYGTAADPFGNVYITGQTQSAANIAVQGAFLDTRVGTANQAFLVKLDTNGRRVWGTYYGGTGATVGRSVVCDAEGNIYMAGETSTGDASNEIATVGASQAAYAGVKDGFLVKFDSSGSRIWGTYYGGSASDEIRAAAIDGDQNIYVAGITRSSGSAEIGTPGSHQETFGGGTNKNDAFLAKYDSSGRKLWSTYYGGDDNDQFYGVTTDPWGYVYATGTTQSLSGIATPGSHRTGYQTSGTDVVLVKFDSAGKRMWGSYFGGELTNNANGVATDPYGNVYVVGQTWSKTGISTPGAFQDTLVLAPDAFLARFDSSGRQVWGTYYGNDASSGEQGNGIKADRAGNIFIVGAASSPSGILTPGSFQDTVTQNITSNGLSQDAYLSRFDTSGALLWATCYGGSGTEIGNNVEVDNLGNLYLGGVATPWFTAQFLTTPVHVTDSAHQRSWGGGTHDGLLAKFSYCLPLLAPGAIEGPNQVCVDQGEELFFHIDPVRDAHRYTWTWPAHWSGRTAGTGAYIRPADSEGKISVSAHNICSESDIAELEVSFFIRPGIDIDVEEDVLFTTREFISYQWIRNDTLIPGANSRRYSVDANAGYRVAAVDSNGCADTSNVYLVNNVSVGGVTSGNARAALYPNPAGEILYIVAPADAALILTGMDGRTLLTAATDMPVSLEQLPAGIYLARIVSAGGLLLHAEQLVKMP